MIRYDPAKLLRKIAPEKKIRKLLTKGVTLKRAALAFIDDVDFLDRKEITRVALETVKGYQERIDNDPEEKKAITSDPRQLIQRIQNQVVLQVTEEIRSKYEGETYTWLPSDADEPDPEHQLNYGKIFVVGEGEMPGDRWGCRCGMELHVEGSSLEL